MIHIKNCPCLLSFSTTSLYVVLFNLFNLLAKIIITLCSTAPDEPNFISQYPMEEGTDFAQQTRAVNVIDGIIITEVRRIICYNQPIYDDPCLEPDEYAGLTLGVIDDNDFDRTTVRTEVVPSCDQAAILIVDNDSEFALYNSAIHWMALVQ